MTAQKQKWKQEFAFFERSNADEALDRLTDEIAEQYLSNELPWVVGYSGGKDSTATLQLVWMALRKIEEDKRTKPVYVISTDTLVENPIVSAWVSKSHQSMKDNAKAENLNIEPHRLTPNITDSFWVNLVGKGYPAPRQKFRWCTERLKINPSNTFISDVVSQYGEAILVLGIRKAESAVRASTMKKHERDELPAKINPNASLPNSYVYSPIEDWSNDDVWFFLLEWENPWGHDNMELFELYQGATEGGECPLVVTTGTPSCGDSRFGCWVCTLVEKDKSMQAMIQNDEDKKWMMPLLALRNEIDFRAMSETNGDRALRDYRRMNGSVQIFNGRHIPGPYKQEFRHYMLKRILEAEIEVNRHIPSKLGELRLIQSEELDEIRRIWVMEKHEVEDALPDIYQQVTGQDYESQNFNNDFPFSMDEMQMLKELCGEDESLFEMMRNVLSLENRHHTSLKRTGIFKELDKAVERNLHSSEEDAVEDALENVEKHQKLTDSLKTEQNDGILDFRAES